MRAVEKEGHHAKWINEGNKSIVLWENKHNATVIIDAGIRLVEQWVFIITKKLPLHIMNMKKYYFSVLFFFFKITPEFISTSWNYIDTYT